MACLNDAQRELAEENIGLAWYVLDRLRLSPVEYLGAAYEGLCKAAAKFDASKGKFSAYAYTAILNTVKREVAMDEFRGFGGCWGPYKSGKGVPKICNATSLHAPLRSVGPDAPATLEDVLQSREDVEDEATSSVYADEIMDMLSSRQREYITQMLATGDSVRAITTRMGLSHNSINSAITAARRRLKKAMPATYDEMIRGRSPEKRR